MRKKLGLSIAALTAVTAFAFAGTACAKKSDNDNNDNGTYTVTFDANGGLFSSGSSTATKTVDKGGYVSGEEKPTRDSFIFYGWLKDENDIVTVNLSTTAIDGDTTFYAGWKQAVNITYHYNYEDAPNGGVYMTDTIASGSTITEPTDPSRTGWTLDCWTTDAAGDNVWTFATDKAMNNVDLYAQWIERGNEQTTHTITLNIDGVTSTHSINDGSKFSRPDNDPEKDGWDFIEWRVGSLSGEAYNFDSPVTSDITLYAYFEEERHEEQTYTITLHIGDNTTEHTIEENNKFSKPADPELDGHSFIEWRLGSIDGEAYDFDTRVTSDIDLYAYFVDESAVHTITYVLDDGVSTIATNASGNPSRFAEGKAVTLKNPSRACYTFDGWYTDAEFENKVAEISATETDDITLYAKWSYNYPFFVTGAHSDWANYTALKGSADVDKKESNALYPLVIGDGETRTWDGKTFVANRVRLEAGAVATHSYKIINSTTWFGVNGSSAGNAANLVADTNGYYTVTVVSNTAFSSISSITHSLRKFTVSFDLGDSNITFESIEYKDGGNVDEPTITGCTVSAWYKDEQRTIPWDFNNDTVIEDITLYAGDITADEYSVTYPVNPNLTWNAAVDKVSFGGTLDLSFVLGEAYSKSQVVIKINGTVVEGDTYAVTTTGDLEITVSGIVKNKYTVTFYEKDGTKISDVIVEHGKNATAPTAATLTGEKFTGWSGSLINITSDVELTAVYAFIDYKVTFETNGGTKVNAITNAHYGDKLTEPENVQKADCVLEGWYTDADCTVAWDFENDTVPAKNMTLYAKWVEDESINWYTVIFNLYDGGAKYTSTKVSENGTVGKPADPHRDGYVFDDKWYDEDGNEYEFDNQPTGDITLYAGWTLDIPTVVMLDSVSGEYREDGYTLTATTSHDVDGVTYTYKWYKDGVLLADATSATLTVNNVSDSGEYKVVVTANDGTLTSNEAEATVAVTIEKATLPAIENILFKDGDAYSNKISFEADESAFAVGYTLTVLDGDNNVVATDEIAIDEREFTVTAALVGAYTVNVTYKLADGDGANIQNAVATKALTFKGAGTAQCPFVVATAGDLKNVSKYPAAHFVQTADITGITQSTSLFIADNMFTGVYDGGGYSVGKVTSATGLFGYIGAGGTVKNVSIAVTINGGAAYIGGLAAENNGTIRNVAVSGSIISTATGHNDDTLKLQHGTGGVVGKNRAGAEVKDCINNATVRGNVTVGGIVGYNMAEASVTGCTNNGALGTASYNMSWAGGLVGLNGGAVSQSANTATVKAPIGGGGGNGNNYLSGLVGENTASGVVSECVNSGDIDGDYASAGLVSKNSGRVEYCINNGNVKARWSASGGTCLDTGTIYKCIMTGTVSTSGGDNTPVHKTGTATDCYYKNGSESGSKKYDVATPEKAIAILEALGDKFVYDGANVVLAYDKTACVVTFKANDETYLVLNVASGVEIDLAKITAPTAPENYEFGGWVGADGDTITVSGDVELTAQFNKKQYTITFVTDGTAVDNITDDYDKPFIAPSSTKAGYTLAGWFEGDATQAFDFTAERSGNVTLTAKWTANTYIITFDANGGNVTSTEKTVTFDGKYGELPTPAKSGYKFVGWYSANGTDGDDESWGEQIATDTDYTTADNVTIYAKWEQVSNRVLLDYNYVSSPEAHEIGVSDSDETITVNVINRIGYTLVGFATAADGEVAYTTTLTKEQFDELADEAGAVTLYAVWQAIEYTITVDLSGGEWDGEATLTYTVEDLDEGGYYDISALIPTRDCRTFTGWTIMRTGVGEVDHIDLSDDYTITANWSDPSHTEETLEAKDATCTETGLTEGKICSVCGEVLVAQEVVPTIPHNYEDGECTECGKQELKLVFEEVDGGYEVIGISAVTEEHIVIPSEYEGQPVVSIAADAFNDGKDYSIVKSIVVPRSVKTIGQSAFNGCQNIESITLPFVGKSEETTTRPDCFFGYIFGAPSSYSGTTHNDAIPSTLKTVIIAEGCKTIQNSSFRSSSSNTFGFTLVLPSTVTSASGNNNFITTLYYTGTAAEMPSAVNTGNKATIYYYSVDPPTESGNYWHYVDGVPTKWEL